MSSDSLLEGLTVLAALLVAAETGLEMRAVDRSLGPTSIAREFPLLAMSAALFAGLALAVLALIAVVGRWPALKQLFTGPFAAAYGLAWFQGALIQSRLAAQEAPEEERLRHRVRRSHCGPAVALMELGFGAQMGMLLCAIGVRDAFDMAVAAIVVLGVATTGITAGLERTLRPIQLREVLRLLSGALLFALGVGAIIRQATGERATHGLAATFVAGALCCVGLVALLWIPRRP